MGEAAEVVRRKFAAFNAHDTKGMLAAFSPNTEKEVSGARLRGADQVITYFSAFLKDFPDLQATIARMVEYGPVVAVHGKPLERTRETLRTPGGDILPTGQRDEGHFHFDLPKAPIVLGTSAGEPARADARRGNSLPAGQESSTLAVAASTM